MGAARPGVLIVGAGIAAGQLAVELRQAGYSESVTIVGDEPRFPYNRPPLSKEYLLGPGEGFDQLQFRAPAFYADNDIDLIIDDAVVQVHRADRRVTLASGSTRTYDTLVFATGARNRQLPLAGADSERVLGLRTVDDADRLRAELDAGRRAAIIGGGFIGMEIAAVARARGLDVTVVELAPRAMARALSAETAAFITDHLRRSGITFRFEVVPQEIVADAGAVGIVLSGGERIDADFVLLAAGVVPNAEIAAQSGLAVANGIVVDEFLRTEDPHVYAIGDCAIFPHADIGARVRLESVQNATDQARAVAAALTGRPVPFEKVAWFWSHQGDLNLQIAGLSTGGDTTIAKPGPDGRFSAYVFASERLISVESVNFTAEHAAARRVLADGPRPTMTEVNDDGFSLRDYARSRVA